MEDRLSHVEDHLRLVGQQVTQLKELYLQALAEIKILREGGNI